MTTEATTLPTGQTGQTRQTRVWDLPTRLFHWLLVLTIAGSLTTGYIGGGWMQWHLRCGQTALILLAFRIVWGFVGGRWSRWSSFFYTPGSLLRYLRGMGRPDEFFEVGHTPTGALSVFALIGLLVVQVATGLVADDEIATTGPLNRFVAGATANLATGWHKSWGQWLLIALMLLHVAAVLYYLIGRRTNLIRPMLRGDKALPQGTPAARDDIVARVVALLLLAGCVAFGGWVFSLGGGM